MSEILTALGLLVGGFFMLVSGIGLVRFPDVYCRLHAPTKAQTLGMIGLLTAAIFHFERADVTAQAVLVILFLFLTVPTGAHLIARAAYRSGVGLCEETIVDDYGPYVREGSEGGAGLQGPGRGAAGGEAPSPPSPPEP
ncbi:MAG: monovalent cation/H(+) antiporter subunit G [Nitrospinota bacterium]